MDIDIGDVAKFAEERAAHERATEWLRAVGAPQLGLPAELASLDVDQVAMLEEAYAGDPAWCQKGAMRAAAPDPVRAGRIVAELFAAEGRCPAPCSCMPLLAWMVAVPLARCTRPACLAACVLGGSAHVMHSGCFARRQSAVSSQQCTRLPQCRRRVTTSSACARERRGWAKPARSPCISRCRTCCHQRARLLAAWCKARCGAQSCSAARGCPSQCPPASRAAPHPLLACSAAAHAAASPARVQGNKFHRIVQGFCCQGGDVVRSDGSGGDSIYGGSPPASLAVAWHAKLRWVPPQPLSLLLAVAWQCKTTVGPPQLL